MKDSIKKIRDTYPHCCNLNRIATEKGKKYEIICTEEYLRIQIDACVINDNSLEKCDYLFIRDFNCECKKTEFFFVELKGSDIVKAFNQIIATISHIKSLPISLKKEIIFGFIVSSKVPRGGTDVTKLKQIFASKYGKKLEVKNLYLPYKPQ
jgi:hypothetical protein